MYLITKLWGVVSGEDAADDVKEQQAHAAIALHATSAREAWGRFAKLNHTQDTANQLWLKEKFSSFKYTASSISGT